MPEGSRLREVGRGSEPLRGFRECCKLPHWGPGLLWKLKGFSAISAVTLAFLNTLNEFFCCAFAPFSEHLNSAHRQVFTTRGGGFEGRCIELLPKLRGPVQSLGNWSGFLQFQQSRWLF